MSVRLAVMSAGLLASVLAASAQGTGPPPDATVHTIVAEAERLGMLSRLQFTDEQLKQLIAIAKTVEEKRVAIQDHVREPETLQAAWAIRSAMLKGEDPEGLWAKLEAFWEQGGHLEQELAAARQEAVGDALNVLTAEQMALLGARNIEAEAAEMLGQARESRGAAPGVWVMWAAEAVSRIARTAWAEGPEAADQARTDLATFLGRLRKMSEEDWEAQEEQLHTELRTLLETAWPEASDKITQALARERISGLVVAEGALETLRAKLNAPAAQ